MNYETSSVLSPNKVSRDDVPQPIREVPRSLDRLEKAAAIQFDLLNQLSKILSPITRTRPGKAEEENAKEGPHGGPGLASAIDERARRIESHNRILSTLMEQIEL
jgi:hypothetical protein